MGFLDAGDGGGDGGGGRYVELNGRDCAEDGRRVMEGEGGRGALGGGAAADDDVVSWGVAEEIEGC